MILDRNQNNLIIKKIPRSLNIKRFIDIFGGTHLNMEITLCVAMGDSLRNNTTGVA